MLRYLAKFHLPNWSLGHQPQQLLQVVKLENNSSTNGSGDSAPMPPSSPSALPLDGSVVKMKGLPFKATCEDISKFFTGFNLKAENIYLKRHPDGRPNGEVSI